LRSVCVIFQISENGCSYDIRLFNLSPIHVDSKQVGSSTVKIEPLLLSVKQGSKKKKIIHLIYFSNLILQLCKMYTYLVI